MQSTARIIARRIVLVLCMIVQGIARTMRTCVTLALDLHLTCHFNTSRCAHAMHVWRQLERIRHTHTHKYTVFSHTLHVSTLIECIVDACMIGTGTISAATLWFDDGQLHVYQCLGIFWATLRIFWGNFQKFLGHFWVIFVQFVGQFGLFWGIF